MVEHRIADQRFGSIYLVRVQLEGKGDWAVWSLVSVRT
jgi:hypothetical protein